MKKHFRIRIEEDRFEYERDQQRIAEEAALDGFYVIRTSLGPDVVSSEDAVRWYKRLAAVERAFRSLKTVDLHIRPIGHWKPERVRAHVLLCMLAYYVEWHMRRALAPLLFDDHDRQAPAGSPVAPARRSATAEQKAHIKRTHDDQPVQSFQSLLADLATITKNRQRSKLGAALEVDILTTPTLSQQHALDLLGVSLRPT